MNNQHDYADVEVRGLARLVPSKLAKSLIVLLVTAPIVAFEMMYQHPELLIVNIETPMERTVLSLLVALSVALIIALSLVLELAIILSSKKHRRITHWSNYYPILSPKWFYKNATYNHWLTVIFILFVTFAAGYYANNT